MICTVFKVRYDAPLLNFETCVGTPKTTDHEVAAMLGCLGILASISFRTWSVVMPSASKLGIS